MLDIIAVLVIDGSDRVVRNNDGLPGLPKDKAYRTWLMELVCQHEVIMGENAFHKLMSNGGILPCERIIVLTKQENVIVLRMAYQDILQKVSFVYRPSMLRSSANFAAIIEKKNSPQGKKGEKKIYIVGGPRMLYRLASVTSQLYLTRTHSGGDAKLDVEYLSLFPKQQENLGNTVVYGK